MSATSEAAKDNKRRRDRERQAATRAAARAERESKAPALARVPEERPRRGGADGRVLAVIGFPTPAGIAQGVGSEVYYSRDERRQSVTYERWLSLPREEPERPATLVTPKGRYSFFVTDEHDIARAASLAVDDLPSISEMDLREALSRVQPGRVFTLRA